MCIRDRITVDGDFYALPFIQSFWVVFYNKDLFDAAGVEYPTNDMTLEEYDALARQLTSGEGAEKVYGCHYHNWRSCVQLFGILDGKNTIVDGTYDFLQPYYEMILAQQDDGICMDYATIKTGKMCIRDRLSGLRHWTGSSLLLPGRSAAPRSACLPRPPLRSSDTRD